MKEIPAVVSCFVLIVLVMYIRLLVRSFKEDIVWTKCIRTGFFISGVTGFFVHAFILFRIAGCQNWLNILVVSLLSTAEMFVGSTKMFDNGFQDFLFTTGDIYCSVESDVCLVLLTGVLAGAVISSGYLILNFFFKRFGSSLWLNHNKPYVGQRVHLFFGYNSNVELLSKDIHRSFPKDILIAVDYPDKEDADIDVSIWVKILSYISYRPVEHNDGLTVLKSKCSLAGANPTQVFKSLGLGRLYRWLTKDTVSTVFFLSDDAFANRQDLKVFYQSISDGAGSIVCDRVFCHARITELDLETEDAYKLKKNPVGGIVFPELVFIDSSKLAIRSLIRGTTLSNSVKSALPIDYVTIATDEQGQKQGYVESAFNAIIIGLGETGYEALKFLYEYGAFVNKDFKKNEFSCKVFDQDIAGRMKSLYNQISWADQTNEIRFFNFEVDTDSFWEEFERDIETTNYILIALGNDTLTLEVANSILNRHLNGRDTSKQFVMLIKQSSMDSYSEMTLKSINEKNNNCLRAFGQKEDIWRHEIISDDCFKDKALQYFIAYQKANTYPSTFTEIEAPKFISSDKRWDDFIWGASREQKIEIEKDWIAFKRHRSEIEWRTIDQKWSEELKKRWEERDEMIRTGGRKIRTQCLRQRTQDISNVLHQKTKLTLVSETILKQAGCVANDIPGKFFGSFYDGNNESIKSLLIYLAVGEHLRWNASHQILGYVYGIDTNDLIRTHKCLTDYEKLDEGIKHYDWLVVKATLMLYSNES